MFNSLKTTGLAIAAGSLALSAPASAAPATHAAAATPFTSYGQQTAVYGDTSFDQYRGRWDDRRYGRGDRYNSRYDDRVYRDTRVWRGNDGRYYCQRKDGTTGLLIGGAAGALLGREIAGRNGDRTLGAILGAAGGALLGREIDRGGSKCR